MNYELRITENQKGFTLVEVLVSVSIIIVIGVIVGSIVISTLRGSTKASVLSDVKQNGDYAIAEMSRVIRSAATLDLIPCGNPSPTKQKIIAYQLDNSQTTFDCTGGTTILENGNSLIDTSIATLVPSSCKIVCRQQSPADIPTVQIQFSLMQANINANFAEQTAQVPFQTTVSLRNVQQ